MAADEAAERFRCILLKAVCETKKIDSFTDDLWISYCKDWNPEGLASERCVTLDPAKYRNSFLNDFLRHCSDVVQSDHARTAFTQRTSVKLRPAPICGRMLLQQADREIRHVVICVGQGELTTSARNDNVFRSFAVALPSAHVTHSGTAVAMLLESFGSGLFEQTVGAKLATDLTFSCVHFEGKFKALPSRNEGVHVNRIDNINNVLRAFGVDAGASSAHMGSQAPKGVLDPRLSHFIAAGCSPGVSAPYVHIEPRAFIQHLTLAGTKVLHDKLLVQQIADCG